ncbi:MAG TPA: alpha/beta hydrolase fold domain-containing protein [Kofleriaceae bacterium]|jgi:cation diffusion facilitator CzcD-associated flavoprotein CzcO/acetyl esterase/lipase
MSNVARHVRVAIIGSGFGGLGMAIRLSQSGERDFVVLERGTDVGGVWRDNTYPGCACDVQSHLYSFSFARNPNWSFAYSPQQEILAYLRDCADRFNVRSHIKFETSVQNATWEASTQQWRLDTTHGVYTADVLVSAVGGLSEPTTPKLPGIEKFRGPTFHSARWRHDVSLKGKRVAVIGTGASAIQFVPAIQPDVAHLTLFQRTAPWVLPRDQHAYSETQRRKFASSRMAQLAKRGWIYGTRELNILVFKYPGIAKLIEEKLARKYLAKMIEDPVLRAKVTPDYAFGCKRVLISDNYYPALVQPNVTVETDGIAEITENAVVTKHGTRHEVDAIVFGTGFAIQAFPFGKHVRGRDGRTLHETWNGTMTGHRGTTIHNFPNLFVITGPNSGLGHTSMIQMIETQIEHVLNALSYMDKNEVASVEPRAEAQAAWNADVQARTAGTVWTAGGCNSWYLDENGRNSALWPGSTFTYRRQNQPFRAEEFTQVARAEKPIALRPMQRVQAAFGRLLAVLPDKALRRMAGKPIVVDGQTLAPDLQIILKAMGPIMDPSPGELRKQQRIAAVVANGAPVEVRSVRDLSVDGLRARHYASDSGAPLLVFLHGGGFVFGDLDTHDRVCRMLCKHAGIHVLAIDYRLAPEHPFPAGIDDGERAFLWARAHAAELGADPTRIVIGGDSAGGNFATVIAQKLAHTPDAPTAQLLLYPSTHFGGKYASLDLFSEGFFLTRLAMKWFAEQYADTAGADYSDARITPINATDLSAQPPAVIVTAGFDPMRDEGEAYGEALRKAGSVAVVRRFPSLIHGFANMTGVSRSASDAVIEVAGMLRSVLGMPERQAEHATINGHASMGTSDVRDRRTTGVRRLWSVGLRGRHDG